MALLLVPVLGRTAAAQDGTHDRFRNDVSEFEERLAYPPEAVWGAVRQVYTYLGFPVSGASDTTRHVYLTPFLDLQGQLFNRPPADYFNCQQYAMGAGDLNNTAVFTFAIKAVVEPAQGGSVLRTQADVRAKRRMWRSSTLECTSNGRFERQLNAMVSERLRQAGPAPQAARPSSSP